VNEHGREVSAPIQWLIDAGIIPGSGDPPPDMESWPTVPRGSTRGTAYVAGALRGEAERLAAMPPDSGRNAALNYAAWKLSQYAAAGWIDAGQVRDTLLNAALAAGSPRGEVEKTLRSAMTAGLADPQDPRLPPSDRPEREPDPLFEQMQRLTREQHPERFEGPPGPPDPPSDDPPPGGGWLGPFEPTPSRYADPTDMGNARRLVAVFGDRIRYVPAWKRWLIWDGRRWARDGTLAIERMAKAIVDGMIMSAARMADPEQQKKALSWARTSGSRKSILAMIALAGSEFHVTIEPSALDADPWLLNVANGVVDLRTGELGPHDPTLLLTKITHAGFRDDATAAEWTKFLDRIQPDPLMREFLARLLGYALLGEVREHLLPIFYGTGANGKSTLIEAVIAALGDYAGTVDPELLIDTKAAHPTGVAGLFGMRLAVTHETDAGRRLAEGTVKRLTGGDRIIARRMREDFWEFEPSHLAVMLTNHRPVVRGDDDAIWRRLLLIPFAVVIPEDERDPELKARLLLEGDGLLGWLLAGYRDYTARGIDAPEEVRVATRAYRSESDDLNRFIEEKCAVGAHMWAMVGELWGAWTTWCAVENLRPGSKKAFGQALAERGFDPDRRSGGARLWRGIGLATDDDDSEESEDTTDGKPGRWADSSGW